MVRRCQSVAGRDHHQPTSQVPRFARRGHSTRSPTSLATHGQRRRQSLALCPGRATGKAIAELEGMCHPKTNQGQRYARFNPITQADCDLFSATLAGEHALNGFRNKNLQAYLYPNPAKTHTEQRQRSAHVTRLVAKLRGHGLISKVKDTRLYRSTLRGARLMSAAILCRNKTVPAYAAQASKSSRLA